MTTLRSYELPNPSFYKSDDVARVFPPNYNEIMATALEYARTHKIKPRRKDDRRLLVGLTVIDQQITFCLENGELTLYPAAVADTQRICEFLYRNGRIISDKKVTLDSHYLFQIFHQPFWLKADGSFVDPYTCIQPSDIGSKYFVNPEMCGILFKDKDDPMKFLNWLQSYVLDYTLQLEAQGKPPLVVWPMHGRLAHHGHALVPSFASAIDFHDLIRYSETEYRIKGDLKLSEYYSPFGTEVKETMVGGQKVVVGEISDKAIGDLLKYRVLVFAGEARSHCYRAAIMDVLAKIKAQDPQLARRVYLMEDCTSNVPGFEQQGDDALELFKAAGMHVVQSTTPMEDWPEIPQEIFAAAA